MNANNRRTRFNFMALRLLPAEIVNHAARIDYKRYGSMIDVICMTPVFLQDWSIALQ